ncbi:hypothetical protein BF49_1313 [Bradyrhizobium sp.]|uniref:hypothetical protein n=1 Tax=unclassified Bradyrhizobium TaxID=2631580 RepID=UPI00024D23B9|nr:MULTISPECIES: hypothetical protein [Bradyrhizobium]EHR02526.1 hypothetical protein Bra471DRAFT_03283 [Bradyrhizobium sp. WSM471]UFW44521.1 hypothetical protein BcanWSM471_16130 [Bradyrhizobium canariense]CUT10233.1 hypothetical protein BF49_1313 [Bradyrhizobium sp.]
MSDIEVRDQQVRIARYRSLERDVADPLAIRQLHTIIEELESDLRGGGGPDGPPKHRQNS